MPDASSSTESAAADEEVRSTVAGASGVADPTPGPEIDPDTDSTTASSILAEVFPGIAAVFGEVPPGLDLDPVDLSFLPSTDRQQISSVLAALGSTATVAGNLSTAFAGVHGLYRLSDATQNLLRAGGMLAVKDGANLGTVMSSGRMSVRPG